MDEKTYGGAYLRLRVEGHNRFMRNLKILEKNGKNLSSVLKNTVKAFQINMKHRFDVRITPDEPGQKWKRLTKKYAKWKQKEVGNRIANLILSGDLKKAVYGGPGWYQKISAKRADFGIRGIEYAAVHQYGSIKKNIPARRYFLTKRNKLPVVVYNYLISAIRQKVEQGVK